MGAGTALPSIVARIYCQLGQVTASDDLISNPVIADLIDQSLGANRLDKSRVEIRHLRWSQFERESYSSLPKIDFLIGSDVFFDPKRK